MDKSEKGKPNKWVKWISNLFFVGIIFVLIIPSWRLQFQSWFQGFFLDEIELTQNNLGTFPQNERNWEIFRMDGELLNFNEFSGHPVVLNFWATWCASCLAELPQISRLKKNVNEEVKFISISEENIDLINKTSLPEKYDFLYCSQITPPFFEVTAYPTLAILDKNWNLVYRSVGAAKLDNQKNIDFLNGLLEN